MIIFESLVGKISLSDDGLVGFACGFVVLADEQLL